MEKHGSIFNKCWFVSKQEKEVWFEQILSIRNPIKTIVRNHVRKLILKSGWKKSKKGVSILFTNEFRGLDEIDAYPISIFFHLQLKTMLKAKSLLISPAVCYW